MFVNNMQENQSDLAKALMTENQAAVAGIPAGAIGGYGNAPSKNIFRLTAQVRDSLARIDSALGRAERREIDPLTKADLDNGIRHATQLAKKLREIKTNLFPAAPKVEEKATNGTATPAV